MINISIIVILYIDPPNILKGLSNVTYNTTDVLVLSCEYSGFPQPFISWLKSNTEILPNNRTSVDFITLFESENNSLNLHKVRSTLMINNLLLQDEGTYYCNAFNNVSNFIDTIDSSESFVTIQSKHSIIVYQFFQ